MDAKFLVVGRAIVDAHRRQYHGVYYMKGGLGNILSTIAEVALPVVGSLVAPGIGTALGVGADSLGAFTPAIEGAIGGAVGGAGGSAIGGSNPLVGAGLGALGGGIANGGLSDIANATGLSNFADSTGLSSLLGGTPQSTDSLQSLDTGLTSAPSAGLSTATNAAVPSAATATSALPSGVGTAGAAAGGASGGGLDLVGAGESLSTPSASGIGGNAFDANGSSPFAGAANALTSDAAPIAQVSPIVSSPILDTSALNTGITPGIGGTQSNGILSSISNAVSGNPAAQPGAYNFDINGNPVGASAGSIGNQFQVAGADMGTSNSILSSLGNLLGGGSSGAKGGGTQMINGLLRTGLSGLLNNPNNSGYNSQIQAAQNVSNDYEPFLQSGQAASTQLSGLLGTGGNAAQAAAQANFANTPGYQFALQQGENAVNANAAKMGQVLSGNNQQAINNYAQGEADQTYNNYLQNLQNQVAQGVNAAGGVATGQTGVGNSQAGKSGASANNQNTTLAGLLQSLFPSPGISFGSSGLNFNDGRNGLLSLFS